MRRDAGASGSDDGDPSCGFSCSLGETGLQRNCGMRSTDWSRLCGRMCEVRFLRVCRRVEGGSEWESSVHRWSLRISLDLGGVSSADGTGSVRLEETEKQTWV